MPDLGLGCPRGWRTVALIVALLLGTVAGGLGCGSGDAAAPSVAPPPTFGAPPPAMASGDVLLERDGALEGTDLHGTVSFIDRYDVAVQAGERVRITLTSQAFDPVLEVTPPRGAPLTNDDVAGDRTRSELELISPTTGPLKIQVTSFVRGAQGAYHVRVARVPAPAAVAAVPVAPIRRHHVVPATAAATTTLALGDRASGSLDASDLRLESGETADLYALELAQTSDVTIQMQSSAFDSYLVVRSPDGALVENDDSGGSLDSTVTIPSAAPGRYTIVVSSYRAGATGAYELKVLPTRDAPTGAPAVAPGAEQVIAGELAAGDAQLASGEYRDEHAFTWAPGTAVHLEARSTAFDSYLILRTPSGQQRDNDDQSPGVLNAGLDFVVTEPGEHRVLVTSYRPGEIGAYQLAIRGGASDQPIGISEIGPIPEGDSDAYRARPGRARPGRARPGRGGASVDREISGTLAAGDATLRSGEFADTHTMSFPAGAPISIRLDSGQFDPYLIVRSPSGRQQDNDDLRPGVLNSGIDIPSAEAGEYQILATSYRPGEAGAYTLRVTRGTSGSAPPAVSVTPDPARPEVPPTVPGVPPAAPATGSRVWVLTVGISDYPGGANDLPECANDAVKIAEALRNQGLTTPEREFLLTDSQATISNIRTAMQRITAQIQPDDTFVFFYSGHGGQATGGSRDPRELDGIDEYIFVYDGQLLDDDLGRMFDQVRARTSVAAIDACFAGGFAKDLVTRPGVVGMFSSEEDVTSAVAAQFQAGGYLSHFLRLGIQGEADSDPRDRVMTVGELTHFVWQQYARQASDVRMGDSYQHLVVDRGAVHTTQQLWRSGA